MFTGLISEHTGVTGNSQAVDWAAAGGEQDAIGVLLQAAGYETALFGKYLNRVCTDNYVAEGYDDFRGMVDDSHLGGAHAPHAMGYTTFYLSVNGSLFLQDAGDNWTGGDKVGATNAASDARDAAAASSYQTDQVNRRALTFLSTTTEPFYMDLALWAPHGDATNDDKPVPASRHAALSFTATHNPSWNEADISDKPKWVRDSVPNLMTVGQQTYADEYDVAAKRTVQAVDELLFDVVRALTAAGRIDRTGFIVVADNGTMGGEHRMTSQTIDSVKNVPYQSSIAGRLFVHWPTDVPAGTRANWVIIKLDDTAPHVWDEMAYLQSQVTATNDALVGNIDICPTIVDPARARFTIRPDGMSLRPLLEGTIAPEDFRSQLFISYRALEDSSVTEMPSWDGVVTYDDRKYIRYLAHEGDPAETEYYDSSALAADELVASQTAQADLEAAVTSMLAG